jgi:hypothetical protein
MTPMYFCIRTYHYVRGHLYYICACAKMVVKSGRSSYTVKMVSERDFFHAGIELYNPQHGGLPPPGSAVEPPWPRGQGSAPLLKYVKDLTPSVNCTYLVCTHYYGIHVSQSQTYCSYVVQGYQSYLLLYCVEISFNQRS